ncbi:hypothetical protein OGAPHI_000155 [Ogataea philodendri]|uniref:Uncharacterized protein n=1 Tax=Ogataea philodendri TaxID=1378263 RepID=A0A9P8PIM9_9ASCO|nr:uncharacterized protein OGAPHI_000155 [Ogataea philodendri]KAH3671969.1 hypothetical protein OGAPHI_000155 [Ogataea philodendri]
MYQKSNSSRNQPSQQDMSAEHSPVPSTQSPLQGASFTFNGNNVFQAPLIVVHNSGVSFVVSPSHSDRDVPVPFGGSTFGSRSAESGEQNRQDNAESVPNRNTYK